ncbi:MAG: tetratricopeptide repeat protein [Alphaproteobacteria bacterium]
MRFQPIGTTLPQPLSRMRKRFQGFHFGRRARHADRRKREQLQCSRSPALLLALTFPLAFTLFAGCSSQTAVPETRYVPAGDLLDIVKDFQRLAKEDTYRFPIPKDITGINIMKATLVRLSDYEKKNPGKFTDIVLYNKALALERLREYDQALAHFRKVAETEGRLGAEAVKNAEALEAFQRIIEKPLPTEDPFKYIAGLDEKVAAWNQLIQKYHGTSYEYLARVEEERIDRAKVTFVEVNRYRLKEGNQLVILGYSQLVTKHRQSKNIHRFLIDFGDFYALLAKEYASQYDPEGLKFDFKTFDELVNSALKLYTEVAQVDGILEKIEAQGKIEAMRGFLEKVTRLNR